MKSILVLLVCLLALAVAAPGAEPSAARAETGKLQHVVSFKFKPDANPTQIREVERAFAALPKKINVIKHFEWGTNVSPEKHDKGFTHCFILTFQSAADRDAYLVHPDHKAFGSVVGPVLDDVFVLDFWAK